MNRVPTRAKALPGKAVSAITLQEGAQIMKGSNGVNDQKVLQDIARMTNIFPMLRMSALAKLNGGATREFKEELAGNSRDPHPEVRVMVIEKLSTESTRLLDLLRRNRKEPMAVRDAANMRYNGLRLLGRGGIRAV